MECDFSDSFLALIMCCLIGPFVRANLNIDSVFCVDFEVQRGFQTLNSIQWFQNLDCNVTDMVDCQVACFIVLPHVNMDPIINKINFNCDYNVFLTVVVDLL